MALPQPVPNREEEWRKRRFPRPVAEYAVDKAGETPESRGGKERRAMIPSYEVVTRFLSASLGGALIGGLLLGSVPMVGALTGAVFGAGVVAFRMRHAH
jgi:predicted lipid-binding transport protein (Tim44 family)